MKETYSYTSVAVALHWIIAFSIVGLILVGWQMTDMELGAPGQEQLYQMHKSFGITVLLLTVARIVWRILNPPPPLPEGMKAWEKTLAHGAHVGLYGLMLAMPLSGWLYVSTAYEFDVPTVLFGLVSWPDIPGVGFLANEMGHTAVENVHGALAWLAVGLIALHVGGAVKHDLMDGEGVLNRILPGWLGPTRGPVKPASGSVAAFGSAVAIFAVIAGLPVLAQGSGAGPLEVSTVAAENWQVDAEADPIRFKGIHDGNEYTGEFADWTASIAFDPDAVSESRATITVDLTSVVASKKLYTDSLKAPEWFNSATFPTATVEVRAFRIEGVSADGQTLYEADATLTLKDQAVDTFLYAEIEIDGDTASVIGEADFSRSALDLGMSSDPNADWVADPVSVSFDFTASRTGD
ncbi:MAG: cytochrome b/b6 domain-containing protein [Pseudomonadota bacterium]